MVFYLHPSIGTGAHDGFAHHDGIRVVINVLEGLGTTPLLICPNERTFEASRRPWATEKFYANIPPQTSWDTMQTGGGTPCKLEVGVAAPVCMRC